MRCDVTVVIEWGTFCISTITYFMTFKAWLRIEKKEMFE